jgi:sortase A
MKRTALALIAALVAGASAGFLAHDRAAGQSSPPVAAQLVSSTSSSSRPPERHTSAVERRAVELSPPRLSIPRLHLRSRVFSAAQLNRGPAWWPVTGRPGGGDTVAIAGHRTTHTHPFYYLERLRAGDAIYVTYRGRAYRYRVASTRVIPASNEHIADAVGHERLLLSACTPRGSAAYRLVVEARPDF